MPVTGVKAIKKTNKKGQEFVVYKGSTVSQRLKSRVRSRKPAPKPSKLRATITPGTVLILIAGRFRGKRVVFLKRLDSGLLLITGPYKVNGVPLRRVNAAYVIATSTKIDVSKVNIPTHINDEYFKKERKARSPVKSEEQFIQKTEEKTALPEGRKADQKTIDEQVLPLVNGVEFLGKYLGARFSLSKGQTPHTLVF